MEQNRNYTRGGEKIKEDGRDKKFAETTKYTEERERSLIESQIFFNP